MSQDIWTALENVLLGNTSGSLADFGFQYDELLDMYWSLDIAGQFVDGKPLLVNAVNALADQMVKAWMLPANDPNQSTLF
jgi:hypothetical protein